MYTGFSKKTRHTLWFSLFTLLHFAQYYMYYYLIEVYFKLKHSFNTSIVWCTIYSGLLSIFHKTQVLSTFQCWLSTLSVCEYQQSLDISWFLHSSICSYCLQCYDFDYMNYINWSRWLMHLHLQVFWGLVPRIYLFDLIQKRSCGRSNCDAMQIFE